MKSIYNPQDNLELIARIEKLNPDSKALWGKMSVDQMLKHTSSASEVAFGDMKLNINFFMRFLGRMMKNKIFNSEFKKNSPTAPEFIFKERYDFDAVKNDLIKNVQRFGNGHQTITVMNHPFWGEMTYEDWDKLMWKHIDHHLRQFGV